LSWNKCRRKQDEAIASSCLILATPLDRGRSYSHNVRDVYDYPSCSSGLLVVLSLFLRSSVGHETRNERIIPYCIASGCIPIAIRARFEYDSSAIRALHSMLQHATRFFVRSHTSPIRAPYENRVEACHTVD